jgi:hypothetical protein
MELEFEYQDCQALGASPEAESVFAWEKYRQQLTCAVQKYQSHTWVKLFNPPTAFSFEEAWLLCECDDNQWLAWIPDYGEILLHTDEFCQKT